MFTSVMMWELDLDSRQGLATQIVARVRRGLLEGDLHPSESLPSSGELARLLGVNANTVLAAYRTLRNEGVLEFRRGRGVRVRRDIQHDAEVMRAAREFVDVAARFGYPIDSLPELLKRAGA